MLYREIIRLFSSVPGLPKTLRQSFENPVQSDRLPDTAEIQTEFPAYSKSRAEAKKVIRNTLLVAAFVCLLRSIPEHFLPIPWAYDIYGVFASMAAVAAIACLVGWPTKTWHYLLYMFALPALVLYLLYLRSLFALLLLAAVTTAIVADRFTKLTLYLGTTTPFPRDRAKNVRNKWRTRFFSLNTIRGMEFYVLLVLLLIAMPFIFDGLATAVDPQGGAIRLTALMITLGIVLLSPLAIELLAALLYNRSPLRISIAWQAFRRSFIDWNCYDTKNVAAPGVLQSPVGPLKTRRRLLVATIYLWSAAFIPLLSYRHATHEKLAIARTGVYSESIREKQKETAAREKAFREFVTGDRTESPSTEVKKALSDAARLTMWNGELDSAPGFFSKLEPFQLRLLEQLPVDKRHEYIRDTLGIADGAAPAMTTRKVEAEPAPRIAPEHSPFFLFSGIEHPSQDDVMQFGRSEGREGFVFTQIFFIFAIEELIMLLAAFSFPLAFFYAASVRVAASLREQLEAHPDTILSFGNWNRLVDDVAASSDDIEKKSLLLGTNQADGSPVLVPREVFEEHAHILGDSGSGKTSLGISLILNQLIRQPDCSIVVIDLKGDDTALFTGTQMDAEKANKPFRWFTNELGKSSYAFNPLTQEYFGGLSLYQQTDVITAALGLQYGTDYGRGYFSDANADYLYRTLQTYPSTRSFRQLARILPSGHGVPHVNEARKAATHLISVAQRLAATETLNVIDDGEYPKPVLHNQIEFADVFRTPQVVYLQLPSSLGTTSSAEIARIALYSLIGSARQTPDSKRKQVFVFIDEFQRIVANNLELMMQTARSMKIGLILANQSIYDLKKPGVDLMPTVRTNTRYKQVFAASNVDDLRELVEVSGEALVHTRSYGGDMGIAGPFGGGLLKLTHSESTSPRLRTNDILLATDHPDQSVVQIRRGSGYAQYGGMPFVMRSQFHISPDEYKQRKEQPWPEKNDQTIIGTEVRVLSVLDEFDAVDPHDNSPRPDNTQGLDKETLEFFEQTKQRLDKRAGKGKANKSEAKKKRRKDNPPPSKPDESK